MAAFSSLIEYEERLDQIKAGVPTSEQYQRMLDLIF